MENVELVPVLETEKSILSQLIELYEYDFSEYNHQDVNFLGRYGYSYLDYYWTEEKRYPYFIKVNNQLAGFALICDFCYVLKNQDALIVSEFFVMKKYRKQGIGKRAAIELFKTFNGLWELTVYPNHPGSLSFWLKVVSSYTNDRYEIHRDVEGVYDDALGIGITFEHANNE